VAYASLTDLRAEGVTPAEASDKRLRRLIREASALIDAVTGRFFEPRRMTLALDGTGTKTLWLGVPVIQVERVRVSGGVVPAGDYVVYNRHLTQGLQDPDDREQPRVVFRGPLPRGPQLVEVAGVFGYTDQGGGRHGRTPELIRRACILLVVRDLARLGDREAREEAEARRRIVSEKTRDQAVTYEKPERGGPAGELTGDVEVDRILALYRRPAKMAAV